MSARRFALAVVLLCVRAHDARAQSATIWFGGGLAADLKDQAPSARWSASLAATRPARGFSWGFEGGYTGYGAGPAITTTVPGTGEIALTEDSRSAWQVGMTVIVPIGERGLQPVAEFGLDFYRLQYTQRTTYYDPAGTFVTGVAESGERREGPGVHAGLAGFPVHSSGRISLGLGVRLDVPIVRSVGADVWTWQPVLGLRAVMRWRV